MATSIPDQAPRTCLCGCGETVQSLAEDALEPDGIFAGDACAVRWAHQDAANQFDRGELNWCDDCGRTFNWDGGNNECPFCADRSVIVRVTLDVSVKAEEPGAAIDVVRLLARNPAQGWLDCPSIADAAVIMDVAVRDRSGRD